MKDTELHDLAKKIAPLIGYEYPTDRGWPGNFDHDGSLRSGFSRLVRKENGEIVGAITIDPVEYGHNKGRLEIMVSWPSAGPSHGYKSFSLSSYERQDGGDRKTSISVAGSKSPEQIAKDIKSRLLEDAEFLYQKAAAKMKAELDYQAKKKAAIIEVARFLGGEREIERLNKYSYDTEPTFNAKDDHDISVQVRSGDSFTIRIDVDSTEAVKKIVDLYRDLKELYAVKIIHEALSN